MMENASALEAALYLMQSPSQVKLIRSRPLPHGVEMLLRVAANDPDTIRKASEWLGRSPETIRQAAAFFIEQILFFPNADSYRILGTTVGATNTDLRRNMALLLRWLHPDLDPKGERTVFARRVTLAWNDLKTQQRRDAYDRSQRLIDNLRSSEPKRRRAQPKLPQAKSKHRRDLKGDGLFRRSPKINIYPGGFLRRMFQSIFDRFAL
jgi:hypothetical protein